MILTIDIGNTNVKFGLFDGEEPRAFWRVSTKASRTSDEYGMVLYGLLRQNGISFDNIEAAVMSSVTPALSYTICARTTSAKSRLLSRRFSIQVSK